MSHLSAASQYTSAVATAYNLGYAKALGLTNTANGSVGFKIGCTVTSSAARRGLSVAFTSSVESSSGVTAPTASSVTTAVTASALAANVADVISANNLVGVTPPIASQMTVAAATVPSSPPSNHNSDSGGMYNGTGGAFPSYDMYGLHCASYQALPWLCDS